MTIRQFIKKLFVTIIMIGIVLAAILKVGYILICKVIVVIIFVVLAIQYWVGEDIRKAEEEKRGTWLFTLRFIGLTVLTMLAANIPGQVQQDQYLYLTKEDTEQLEKVLLREATADSERCIQWYEKQMLGIRNNKALGNPAMQTEDERRYKNRIDGKEVYRDPDTCTLRVKELKDGSTKDSVLINGPVGEIIAMRERIFYIDMEDHNVLKSVTYDGRKRKTWTKDPVKQFAVIGGYVICCTVPVWYWISQVYRFGMWSLRKRGSLRKKEQRVLEFRPDAVVVSLERYVTLVWQRQLRRLEKQTAYRNICADTQKQRSDI